MYDVKVGDRLLCTRDGPWGAYTTKKGDTVIVTKVANLGGSALEFCYKNERPDIHVWFGNNTLSYFTPLSVDLENK